MMNDVSFMNCRQLVEQRGSAFFARGGSNRILIVLWMIALLAGCTDLKRNVYEGFDRDAWQFPDKVIQSLGIRPGNSIADLGSGSGYFTFRLARAAGPTGKVYAVDVDQSMNRYLEIRVREEKQENVEVVLAKPDDPLLPENRVDLIFTVNTYHHLEDRAAYFRKAKKYLRKGGRVAIIDFREGFFSHHTPGDVIKTEMKAAGYRLKKEFGFLPKQNFMVFSPVTE